jgi:hypothetical protein
MILIERLQIRPDKNVPFWTIESVEDDTEFRQYFFETYISTGKFISGETQVSDNELELKIISTWVDGAAADEFKNDPVVKLNFFDKKAIYLNTNGITEELIKYELL